MSTKFSRRDALRLLGLSAGVTALSGTAFATNEYGQPIDQSIESHLMGFMAEESRKTKKVMDIRL